MRTFISDFRNGNEFCYEEAYNKRRMEIPSYFKGIDFSEQKSIYDLFGFLDKQELLEKFLFEMDNFNEKYILKSYFHGKNHNIKTLFFSIYLSCYYKFNEEDLDIIIQTSKYHDTGRLSDYEEDKEHGFRSSLIIDKILGPNYPNINYIKALMELHTLDESFLQTIGTKYSLDIDRLKKLNDVFKDSDALDRTRLNSKYQLNTEFLRLDESKKIVKASYQLNEYYLNKKEKYSIILDTDPMNEMDDQLAIYDVLNSDVYNIDAITLVPFHGSKYSKMGSNTKSNLVDSMEENYHLTMKLLKMMQKEEFAPLVYKGSTGLLDYGYNEENESVKKIIETCHSNNYTHVLSIGGLTNIALALRLDPSIKDKLHLIWLGGNDLHYGSNNEFNFRQDLAATKEVFESGVYLTIVPCISVALHATDISLASFKRNLEGKSEYAEYLISEFIRIKGNDNDVRKSIWDIAATGYLQDQSLYRVKAIKTPKVLDDLSYDFNNETDEVVHFVRKINKTRLQRNFFNKF